VSRLPESDADLAWDRQAWGEGGAGGGQLSSRSAGEIGLAVEALAGLARDPHGRQRMCQARLPPLLRAVASATRRSTCDLTMAGCGEDGHGREGWVLRERHLAVAMGQVCRAAHVPWLHTHLLLHAPHILCCTHGPGMPRGSAVRGGGPVTRATVRSIGDWVAGRAGSCVSTRLSSG
jgi:hypothetical protein